MIKLAAALGATLLCVVVAALAIGPTTLKRWAYEDPGRERWQQRERVISTLGVGAGDVVADLGAGGGYFTFPLAEA